MASGIFFRNVPGARKSARWPLGAPRASHQKRGALGRGTFFPEVLWLCASGPQARGPSGTRISNLRALRPIVSERGTSRFPFKRVPFWWTHAPFLTFWPPKKVVGSPDFSARPRGSPRGNDSNFGSIRPLRAVSTKPLGRTHSNNLKVGLFSEMSQGSQTLQGGCWGPPMCPTES